MAALLDPKNATSGSSGGNTDQDAQALGPRIPEARREVDLTRGPALEKGLSPKDLGITEPEKDKERDDGKEGKTGLVARVLASIASSLGVSSNDKAALIASGDIAESQKPEKQQEQAPKGAAPVEEKEEKTQKAYDPSEAKKPLIVSAAFSAELTEIGAMLKSMASKQGEHVNDGQGGQLASQSVGSAREQSGPGPALPA